MEVVILHDIILSILLTYNTTLFIYGIIAVFVELSNVKRSSRDSFREEQIEKRRKDSDASSTSPGIRQNHYYLRFSRRLGSIKKRAVSPERI